MKHAISSSIPNIVGILLVIVALVSAGGLLYTASVYTRISDTYVSVESSVTGVTVVYDNSSETVLVTVSVLIDNPSPLDIEVYRIEYMAYMDRVASSIMDYDRYIGSGSTSDRNNTVRANSVREMQVSFLIDSESSYFERFQYATEDSPYVYTLIDGIVWFNISGYGEVQNQVGISSMENLEVRYV